MNKKKKEEELQIVSPETFETTSFLNSFEEKTFVETGIEKTTPEPSVFDPIEPEQSTSVFEQPSSTVENEYYKITFIDIDEKEKVFYTPIVPEIENGKFVFSLGFKKLTFTENVLNQVKITTSYKSEVVEENIVLDLEKTPVLIKKIKEEPWMNVDKTTAEKVFSQKALNEYRKLTSKLKTVQPEKKQTIEKGNVQEFENF